MKEQKPNPELGSTFGCLTVISEVFQSEGTFHRKVQVRCTCGKEYTRRLNVLYNSIYSICPHRGEGSPFWKTGKHKTSKGYIRLTGQYDHPNSDRLGKIFEHVFIMTQILGRPLKPGENVHHRNGIKDDNRPENLELWSTSQPYGQRVEDKTAWAIDWLKQYKPEILLDKSKEN